MNFFELLSQYLSVQQKITLAAWLKLNGNPNDGDIEYVFIPGSIADRLVIRRLLHGVFTGIELDLTDYENMNP